MRADRPPATQSGRCDLSRSAALPVRPISPNFTKLEARLARLEFGASGPMGSSDFELQAIGAAVVGVASLLGGEGNPVAILAVQVTRKRRKS